MGNVQLALNHIQQSLQVSEVKNYHLLTAKNYGDLGSVYAAAGLELDAISFYRRQLHLQKLSANDTFGTFTAYNNIGKTFLDIGYYDSASTYIDRAREYLDDGFAELQLILYVNLSELFLRKGELNKTDSLLNLVFQRTDKSSNNRSLSAANKLKAEVERANGNFDRALAYALIAYDLARESKAKELIYEVSKTLSNCYADIRNFKQAYYFNNVFETYRDSVKNVSSINELELLSYYERLFRLRVLEEKNIVTEALASERQKVIYLLSIILVVAVLMLSIIVRRGRKIRSQAKELESLDTFKNRIFAIVSHDLQSPIQSVASALQMFQEKIFSEADLKKFIPDMKDKTLRLLDLLNNIFQWAHGQIDNQTLQKEEFPLIELLTELHEELREKLEDKRITLSFDCPESFILNSNRGIVRIVLRNLIINAVKYSFIDSSVVVQAYEDGADKKVEVIDHGVGIKKELQSRIFSMEAGTSLGTKGERGNGLGLALCYDFIRGLGGEIELDSEKGKGSTFRICFPDQDALQLPA